MNMKRSILLVVSIVLLSGTARSQLYNRGNLSMGLGVSLHSVRLVRDSIKYSQALLPGLGVELYSNLTKKLKINYGAQFAMLGTNDYDTLGNLRTFHLEPFVSLLFSPVESLFIEAGALYSYVIMAQTVRLSGETASGKKRTPIEGFTSSPEFFAGLHMKASDRSLIGIRYYIPHTKTEFRRFELRFVLIMVEGYPKQR